MRQRMKLLIQHVPLLASLLLAACGSSSSEEGCEAPVGSYELELTIRTCANGATPAPRKETLTFAVDGKVVSSDCVTQQKGCGITVNCGNGYTVYSLTSTPEGGSLTGTKTLEREIACGGGTDGIRATWLVSGKKI
jgi:hypothetical protein